MRLNSKKFEKVMQEKELTEKIICTRTGLYEKSFRWIMDNGFASDEVIERIADAAGVAVGEIVLPDISGNVENTIEFIRDSDRATVTFSQGRYKGRIQELARKRPEECEIIAENKDGSIYAHIPVKWIRINPGNEISEEHKDKLRKNIEKAQFALHKNG